MNFQANWKFYSEKNENFFIYYERYPIIFIISKRKNSIWDQFLEDFINNM